MREVSSTSAVYILSSFTSYYVYIVFCALACSCVVARVVSICEENGLARAQGIQRDPVCEVSLPIDRWSRDPSFDEGRILQNQDHGQLHAPRGAASDFDGLDQVD